MLMNLLDVMTETIALATFQHPAYRPMKPYRDEASHPSGEAVTPAPAPALRLPQRPAEAASNEARLAGLDLAR